MALNAAGDLYVTGATEAINYPTTTDVIEPTCPLGNTQLGAPAGVPKCGEGESGTPAVFVSKISADGQTLLYSTYLGGGGNGAASDYGTGIAVDANDNAWVVGLTTSNDFPITANAYLAFCNPVAQGFSFSTLSNYGEISGCIGNSTRSAFLVQLNPTGTTELYGTFLGGSGDTASAQIVLDTAGNIYVAGSVYTNGVGTPAYVFANNRSCWVVASIPRSSPNWLQVADRCSTPPCLADRTSTRLATLWLSTREKSSSAAILGTRASPQRPAPCRGPAPARAQPPQAPERFVTLAPIRDSLPRSIPRSPAPHR
jgi:hypothetical protein